MRIVLIGKKHIFKENLPKTILDNYCIIDKTQDDETKRIDLVGENGEWKIESNEYSKLINPECLKIENDKIEIIRIRKLYNQKRNIKRKQYVCFNVRKTKRNIYIAVFT